MKVLITGGMGFIGSMVSRRFVEEGHRPVLMARHLDQTLIASVLDKVDIELGDISDLATISSVIERHHITHVVHMAAFVGAVSAKNPVLSVQVNVLGTVNVLEAARLGNVRRVIFTSAKGIYGPFHRPYGDPDYRPLDEDHPKNPVRIYDSAKLMGEHMGQYYHRTYGLEFAAIRFSSTYGPGKTTRHGQKAVVSRIIEGALQGESVDIDQDGEDKNDFIYTKDAAYGVFLACTAPKLTYQAYNIGTGAGMTLNHFAEEIRGLVPSAQITISSRSKKYNDQNCIYDISRARQDLGYAPQFTLEEAVADYVKELSKTAKRSEQTT
jgi:UDP-glucose 4-epimerase